MLRLLLLVLPLRQKKGMTYAFLKNLSEYLVGDKLIVELLRYNLSGSYSKINQINVCGKESYSYILLYKHCVQQSKDDCPISIFYI